MYIDIHIYIYIFGQLRKFTEIAPFSPLSISSLSSPPLPNCSNNIPAITFQIYTNALPFFKAPHKTLFRENVKREIEREQKEHVSSFRLEAAL